MSNSDKRNPKLVEQKTAVMSYLEDLLLEVPETLVEDIPHNVVTVFPKQVHPVELPELPKIKVVKTVAEISAGRTVATDTVKEEDSPEATEETSDVALSYPEWVEDEFQCLMFKVVGISIAVPLNRLNGVITWENNLTPMPGHSAAFLGLLRHLDKNVKVMDVAKVILPAEQLQQLETEDERIHKILLMDEGRWGLACDDVGEVITLKKEEIRWRTTSGRRPWLAGTISERLCALLDTQVMAEMLSDEH